jgi:hypothetical protein
VKLISFAWTTPSLVAGRKTMTWRDWNERYALSFCAGERVQAWDRLPRNHGRQVALIELTDVPKRMMSSWLTDDDYEAEGLAYLAEHPEVWPKTIFRQPFTADAVSRERFDYFRELGEIGWCIRFKLIEVLA